MQTVFDIPVHTLDSHEMRVFDDAPILQRAETAAQSVSYPAHKPHRHDYFEVFLTSKKGGLLELDGQEQDVDPRSILVLPPGVVHNWIEYSGIDGFVARIPVHAGYKHFGQATAGHSLYLHKPPAHVHLTALLSWIADDTQVYPKELTLKRWQLFYEALAVEANAPDSQRGVLANQDLCASFLALLDRKYCLRWSVQDYVNALQVSRSKLLRCTQSQLQCTPVDLIRRRTLREAERLLVTTTRTCSDISDTLGFLSQAQFTHAFSTKFGLSPSRYRAKFDAEQR
jgi:AraC-like DNA-binding protein